MKLGFALPDQAQTALGSGFFGPAGFEQGFSQAPGSTKKFWLHTQHVPRALKSPNPRCFGRWASILGARAVLVAIWRLETGKNRVSGGC